MKDDPIVADIRQARHAHAAQFNDDLSAIVADIRRLERESGRQHVNFAPRRVVTLTKAAVSNTGANTTSGS